MNNKIHLYLLIIVMMLGACSKPAQKVLSTYTSPAVGSKLLIDRHVDLSTFSDDFHVFELGVSFKLAQELEAMGFNEGKGLDAEAIVREVELNLKLSTGINSEWLVLRRRHLDDDVYVYISPGGNKAWLIVMGY